MSFPSGIGAAAPLTGGSSFVCRTQSVPLVELASGGLARSVEDGDRDIQHPNICCDGCEAVPLTGTRYHCLHCKDYDLCSSCWQVRASHDTSHVFLVIPRPRVAIPKMITRACVSPPSPVPDANDDSEHAATSSAGTVLHTDVVCDSCHTHPVSGARYKCIACPDYDLCSQCYQQAGEVAFHDPNHLFMELRSPLSRENLPIAAPSSRPTLSAAMKSGQCNPSDLNSYLRNLVCRAFAVEVVGRPEIAANFSLHKLRAGAVSCRLEIPSGVEKIVTIRLREEDVPAAAAWRSRQCRLNIFHEMESSLLRKSTWRRVGVISHVAPRDLPDSTPAAPPNTSVSTVSSDADHLTLSFASSASSTRKSLAITFGATVTAEETLLVHSEYPGSAIPITVFSDGKPTRQSSAVADDGDSDIHCMTRTAIEYEPWWEIDLQEIMSIDRVMISAEEHANTSLRVCAYAHHPRGAKAIQGHHFVVNIKPNEAPIFATIRVPARFIRITLHEMSGSLRLHHVSVFGAHLFSINFSQTIIDTFQFFRRRPFLGYRPRDDSGKLSKFRWTTYGDVWQRIRAVTAGLLDLTDDARFAGSDGRRYIAIADKNCAEWVVTDMACILGAFVSIPIGVTSDSAAVTHIMNVAEVSVLICNAAFARTHAKSLDAECSGLQVIVITAPVNADSDSAENVDEIRQLFSSRLQVLPFSQIEELGRSGRHYSSILQHANARDLCTVVFTSGSTGTPKGVVRSYAAFRGLFKNVQMTQPMVHLSFQPLSHQGEREMMICTILVGGQVGLYSGDISVLFEDCAVLRPTVFGAVPRVFNMLFAMYHQLLNSILDKHRIQSDSAIPPETVKAAEREAMGHIRGIMGDRMQSMCIGSAPASPAVVQFLYDCFADCGFCEAYGSTEVGTIAADYAAVADADVILADIPELGYFTSGDPPMGEVLVKTKTMFEGYFRDPALTAKAIDQDGWFHTGDIGKILKSGRLLVVGRKTNTFKLAQGEFVAPEQLEGVYSQSPIVEQIHVHGSSTECSVVAIVVPHEHLLRAAIQSEKSSSSSSSAALASLDFASLCKSSAVTGLVRNLLCSLGHSKGLRPYELLAAVYLEPRKFTNENGLLTSTMKPNRPRVEKDYADIFARLYASASQGGDAPSLSTADVSAGNAAEESSSLSRQVSEIVADVLGPTVGGKTDLAAQLGADSLAAIRITSLVKSRLRREIPLHVWFGAGTVSDIVSYLEGSSPSSSTSSSTRLTKGGESFVAPAPQHEMVRADVALPLSVLARIDPVQAAAAAERQWTHVLLTGVTGFLGVFVLARLLEETSSRIVCLVRAETDAAALQRVIAKLAWAKVHMKDGWIGRISAVASDLSKPNLGLDESQFLSLAAECDAIIHCGAVVNWMMVYGQLRRSNVGSVIELIRFATASGKVKPLHYISTISTVGSNCRETSSLSLEEAAGSQPYVASKWVSERLITRASKLGVPVTIIRPAMIGNHSITGVGNITDFNSRFFGSCLQLGIALAIGAEANQVLDMAPVDYVAAAVVSIASDARAIGKTFHVENLRGSPSLVQIAAGLESVLHSRGIECERVDYSTFRSRIVNSATPHPLSPLLEFFPPSGLNLTAGPWDSRNTDEILSKQLGHEPQITHKSGLVSSSFFPKITPDMIVAALNWVADEPSVSVARSLAAVDAENKQHSTAFTRTKSLIPAASAEDSIAAVESIQAAVVQARREANDIFIAAVTATLARDPAADLRECMLDYLKRVDSL